MSRTMFKPLGILLAAACGMAAVVHSHSPASAQFFERRVTALACSEIGTGYARPVEGGLRNAYDLVCPVPSNSQLSHPNVSGLNVHVIDLSSSGSASARACVKYYGVGGGYCSNAVTGSGGAAEGAKTLAITDFSAWSLHPWDFPFVHVELPSSDSLLKGIWLHN